MPEHAVPECGDLFTLAGRITEWDPESRRLRIPNHDVILAPLLPVANLAPGLAICLRGRQDPITGQRIATRLRCE